MSNQALGQYPRSVRVPLAALLIIGGILVATLAWMSFPLATTALALSVARGVLVAGAALALVGVVAWLVGRARSNHGLSLARRERRLKALMLILLLLSALILSALPFRGARAWVANVGFVLALAAALWVGLRLARDGSPALYRQALYALRQGDEERALALLSELEEERPGFYGTPYLRSMILRQQAHLPEALAEAERLVSLRPELYYGHAEIGLTQLALDHVAEAQEALERAVQAAPRLPQAHFNLGMACAEAGDPPCAIEHLSWSLRHGLDDDVAEVIARYYLRESFLALGEEGRAARELARMRRRRASLRGWLAQLDDSHGPAAARDRRLARAIEELVDGQEP